MKSTDALCDVERNLLRKINTHTHTHTKPDTDVPVRAETLDISLTKWIVAMT